MNKSLQRVWGQVSIYLPVLLMALLAMGTWWLVRNAPKPLYSTTGTVAPTLPDYVLKHFSAYQFAPSGRLQSVMTGDEGRHFPATDTVEVDAVKTRSITPDGVITTSAARRGISNSDASEIQLVGDAKVERHLPHQPNQTTRYTGEFLHAWPNEERVESHMPVIVTKGKNRFTGESMRYDNLAQVVELQGRVKGVIYPANK